MYRSAFCLTLIAGFGCGDDGKSVDIVQSSLDFGKTDCGTTAIPRTLVVSNPSGSAFSFTTSLALGEASPYLVVPESGVVLPDRQLELTVYSKPVPAISAVTDNLYGDTLTLTTDESGDSPHAIAITQTAHGAMISLSTMNVAFATTATIGDPPQTQPLTVTNSGNAAVTVSFKNDMSFGVTPAGPAMVAAGGALQATVSYSPAQVGVVAADIGVTIDGPVCAAPPVLAASATSTLAGTAKAVALTSTRPRPRNGVITMCVLTTKGLVACTGSNESGARGIGATAAVSSRSYNLVVTHTGLLDQVTEISSGRAYFCAKRTDSSLWCWGDYNGMGRRGIGDTNHDNAFATQVASSVQAFAGGYGYRCIVSAGIATCSGDNNGRRIATTTWTVASPGGIGMTSGNGYAIQADGTVMSFGENANGERGNNDAAESAPSLVTGLTNVVQVAGGGDGNPSQHSNRHACALETDGSVWCWGRGSRGQLGNNNGGDESTSTPVQVLTEVSDGQTTTTPPLAAVTAIGIGSSHGCAIAGSVYCWGNNKDGELGFSTGRSNVAAKTAPEITNAASISVFAHSSCAVLTTGAVRCWGLRADNLTASTPLPVPAFEP